MAGVSGFLDNMLEFYEEADAETASWRELVTQWRERHGERPIAAADLWPLVNPAAGDPIDLSIKEGSERSQKTQLGKLLHARRDQRFGNVQIVGCGKRQGAQLWRLKSCEA